MAQAAETLERDLVRDVETLATESAETLSETCPSGPLSFHRLLFVSAR